MPIHRKHKRKSPRSGEAGFTMIEMIIVMVLTAILGTFIFQIMTNSLQTLRDMRNRKERGDDAVMVLEKISREIKEAKSISTASSSTLTFIKNVTSSFDTNTVVKYILSTNKIMRYSATSVAGLSSATGKVVAENVSSFTVSSQAGGGASNRIVLSLDFTNGSEWETKIYPRNYGL